MKVGLVGHSGFIGSNLLKFIPNATLLTRERLMERKTLCFDELFIAAPNADKWQINQYPHFDLENINQLLQNLEHVSAKYCTLFSTIDVYEPDFPITENSPVLSGMSYGANRAYFERRLQTLFQYVNVRRLGGLFGPGLKKNVIYDAINLRTSYLKTSNPESRFQYMSIKTALEISLDERFKDTELVNIVGEPMTLAELLPEYSHYFSNQAKLVNYDVHTIKNFDKNYFVGKNQLLSEIQTYISSQQVRLA